MADKLNDEEIAAELKRFGEPVKVPIDKKKRPILIKKLNHFYARENPPVKKGKGREKLARRSVHAEFSDDSQDESESGSRTGRFSSIRANSSTTQAPTTRKTRSRELDNGATVSPVASPPVRGRAAQKKRQSRAHQIEVYPDEFSDADTADESVYEVEEKSIGINTTLNYEEEEDDDDDISITTMKVTPRNRFTRRSVHQNVNISTIEKPDSLQKPALKRQFSYLESGQFISKIILTIVAIFFLILALSYIYLRKDLFFAQQAAFSQPDLEKKEYKFKEVEKDDERNYTFKKKEANLVLPVLHEIRSELASLKGKFELGEIEEGEDRMPVAKVREKISKLEGNSGNLTTLCLLLILRNPDWEILPFEEDGSPATVSWKVASLESQYSNLPLMSRLVLASYKVLYTLLLLSICVMFGVLGIYYLRWQNKKREKNQQKVYELVEKIIDILKEHYELSEQKGDPKNYPPYIAVQHIRDQLIPVSKRRQLKSLWDDAVQFIETNESRIRIESQLIQGEEFIVWRWLQAMPNGHKMWQGQAFGETSQASVNSLPYGPTPCLKVRSMFDANQEGLTDDWHEDIKESVLEKCQDNKGILHIYVDRTSKEGCVYIKCSSCEKAFQAYNALHGWWFDGRLVTVKYLRLEHYHDRFPDSRNCRRPLQPSKPEMKSVSQPYHRSVLEMT